MSIAFCVLTKLRCEGQSEFLVIAAFVAGNLKLLALLVNVPIHAFWVLMHKCKTVTNFPAKNFQTRIPGPFLPFEPLARWVKSRETPYRTNGFNLLDIYVCNQAARQHGADAVDFA